MRPEYEYGSHVRLIRTVRNDGTYPGLEVGQVLIPRGSDGFVHDVGTYLQDQLIYRVNFVTAGRTVGCRGEELIAADREWLSNAFEFRDRVVANRDISVGSELIARCGDEGEVVKVVRESDTSFHYHIRFHQRTFTMPESVLSRKC
jgi:nitrogen fixation protein NifZ